MKYIKLLLLLMPTLILCVKERKNSYGRKNRIVPSALEQAREGKNHFCRLLNLCGSEPSGWDALSKLGVELKTIKPKQPRIIDTALPSIQEEDWQGLGGNQQD